MARELTPAPTPIPQPVDVTPEAIGTQIERVATVNRRVRRVEADHVVVEGDGVRMNPEDQGKVYDALTGVRKYRAYDPITKSFHVIVKKAQPQPVEEVLDGRG